MAGKPRSNEILQWKTFWEREELKMTKMNMKIWKLYVKSLQIASFGNKNFSPFWSWKCSLYFDLENIFEDIRESSRIYESFLLFLKNNIF